MSDKEQNNLQTNNDKKKENKKSFLHLSTQNKLIIIGWFASSVLIFITALFIINHTQKKMHDSYYNFGLILARTLSVESLQVTNNFTDNQQVAKLKHLSNSLIEGNEDIS